MVEPTDWLLLAYAVMSSHIHLALLAGVVPLDRSMRRLNTGLALWLNRSQERTGPVLEQRYKNITVPTERAGYLIAYQHNNPFRAGIIQTPDETAWSP